MNNDKNIKKPISNDVIYKIMLFTAFSTAGIFLIKDLVAKAITDAIVVGVCLTVFGLLILGMAKLHVAKSKREFIVSMFIVLLVFIISINSGDFYSDDFTLYLAVVGITGLYMNPIYTIIQMVAIDILLMVAYYINPQKADPFNQYIMCVFLFSLAAATFYLVINRGNAFIKLAENKMHEANKLLDSIREAGIELQDNCESSSARIQDLTLANKQLEEKTYELQQGSQSIYEDTTDVVVSFEDVKNRMVNQKQHINSINEEVKDVETSLTENKNNLSKMSTEIKGVNDTFTKTNEVFSTLQSHIKNIARVTSRLSNISYNTTILALNASIEAARAGEAGKGFAVVASDVQDLAKDSTECSEHVFRVVEEMTKLIEKTSSQIVESTEAINSSVDTLNGFEDSFNGLSNNFNSLYDNIEIKNKDVQQVNEMVEQLKTRIGMMSTSSENNQSAVSSISSAMDIYRYNINQIITDTQQINELSNSLLAIANKK